MWISHESLDVACYCNYYFAVNYFGTLNVVRALAPVLEKNRGAIATVLSLVSMAPAPGISNYSASKAALDGILSGQEDIFPESEQMGNLFWSDPKAFEQVFASIA